MLFGLSCRFKMKRENLLPIEDPSITYSFELPLTAITLTEDLPQRPKDDIIKWLNEVPTGKFKYIFEFGDLWGIAFELENDAVHFRITWL